MNSFDENKITLANIAFQRQTAHAYATLRRVDQQVAQAKANPITLRRALYSESFLNQPKAARWVSGASCGSFNENIP